MILRAKAVLPVRRPAIRNGAVRVQGSRITAVGEWRSIQRGGWERVIDLGDSLLLPGLVDAHCHLDYTHMAGQFPPPKSFIDWLKAIVSTKAGWSVPDFEASWRAGAEMLVRTGTTTVADIEVVPELLPGLWSATPLRMISFLEMIRITGRRPSGEILKEALNKYRSIRGSPARAGLSPHAPYTTGPELLRLTAQAARRLKLLICTHLAESALEFEMFKNATGAMYEWLRRSGREISDCGLGSPTRHLERCGLLGRNLLVAHANYLGRGDAALLARRAVSVVHCPRSHAYFRHEAWPVHKLRRAGVNVCLGTDSLATVYKRRKQTVELNMFDEMRALAECDLSLSPQQIVRMATANGARALRLVGKVGEISPGAFADLIALPLGADGQDLYGAVLRHYGNVSASMIGGRWALQPAQTRGAPI